MRTTLNVDDGLMARVKELVAARGTTLTAVFEEALRDLLATTEAPSAPTVFEMPVIEGRRAPAFDLADRETLYEHMEGRR